MSFEKIINFGYAMGTIYEMSCLMSDPYHEYKVLWALSAAAFLSPTLGNLHCIFRDTALGHDGKLTTFAQSREVCSSALIRGRC